MLTLLLIGMLTLTFNIQAVKASGTIYIRADGSVEPSTANITSADNVTYYFTGNNYDEIVIEISNIIIDGNGYTLQGTGAYGSAGIYLSDISNVTIKNTNLNGFYYGVYLNSTSHIILFGNNITNNDSGLYTRFSSNTAVYGNNIVNNYRGIDLSDSPNNSICGNNIIASENEGIYLWYSDNSNIFGNNIAFNFMGIYLVSSNNNVSGNSIAWNVYGLWVFEVNNSISGNAINGNYYSLSVWDGMQTHSIDVLNLIDGKPVYYLINQKDLVIRPITYPQVGYLALINCANITVEGLTLTSNGQGLLLANTNNSRITHNHIINNLDGIGLDFSSNNTLSENNITDNFSGVNLFYSLNNTILRNRITNEYTGIRLNSSSNNTISGNNITNNRGRGVYLDSSSNNRFCHNNFIDNSKQVYIVYDYGLPPWEVPPPSPSINTWDDGYPSGGNYWDDYTGIDANGDGIGGTYYIIDANNTDRYPLMHPWSSLPVHNINTGLGYAAIQEALDALETLDGHVIFVETGIYYENVVVDKTVTLVGENKETTFIDGGGTSKVVFVGADNVTISGFRIRNSGSYNSPPYDAGICLFYVDYCNITNNFVTTNFMGIALDHSTSNTIDDNYVTNSSTFSVDLYFSVNNVVSNNIVTNNSNGITLYYSDNNTVGDNNITDNDDDGVRLFYSSNNTVSGNTIAGNNAGIEGAYSYNNTLASNIITNNGDGISGAFEFYNNTIRNNILENNWASGISLSTRCSGNMIFHNNFINNAVQAYAYASYVNAWDDGYPSGGNYWSDYSGVDLYRGPYQNETGSDRIGDTPYDIDENNRDNYPLMNPWTGVFLLGDLDKDGFVGISDISVAAIAFGSFPDHPRWNPIADLNEDGWVDISDIAKIAVDFGKTV